MIKYIICDITFAILTIFKVYSCCLVTQSYPTLCDPMDCSTLGSFVLHYVPEFGSNSCPLSWWCHSTISSSIVPFSSCPQSFPASGSFSVSQLFASGGQSIGASVSESVLPINIQGWFLLGLTGLISLQSKGLSGVVLGIFNCILFFKQTRTKLLVTQSIDIFAATDL